MTFHTRRRGRPPLCQWTADTSLSGIPGFVQLGEKIGRRRWDILHTIHSGLSNAGLEAVNKQDQDHHQNR